MLETIELNTSKNVTGSVIWLHGLGADGNDFAPIIPELNLPKELGLRFIFPHAPVRPITVNLGMSMRGWYDIYQLDSLAREDEQGIRQSQQAIEALIKQEQDKGIPAERIALAGFSQGGAIVLHTGLRFAQPLAGIIALSTYLPLPHQLEAEKNNSNQSIPIYMAHGQYDPVIRHEFAELSKKKLLDSGYAVSWHSYPMEHTVSATELTDIRAWLISIYSQI